MEYKFTITIIPEHDKEDGYMYCGKCGTRLLLAYPFQEWQVDSEPFKDGEEKPADCPEEVDVGEVTGHFCSSCNILTSITYNN